MSEPNVGTVEKPLGWYIDKIDPKYINASVDFKSGQVVLAVDINHWLNALVTQGDHNTAWLEMLAGAVNTAYFNLTRLEARVNMLAAELDRANMSIEMLCALHNKTPY